MDQLKRFGPDRPTNRSNTHISHTTNIRERGFWVWGGVDWVVLGSDTYEPAGCAGADDPKVYDSSLKTVVRYPSVRSKCI